MEKLKSFLEKNKIKYIISIDDDYANPEDDFSQYNKIELIDHILEEINNNEKYQNIIEEYIPNDISTFLSRPNNLRRNMINQYWDVIPEDDIKKLLELYGKENDNILLKSLLKKLKRSNFIKDYITIDNRVEASNLMKNLPEDWKDINEDNKILWLIDLDLTKTGGKKEEGYRILEDIYNQRPEWNIGIILTKEVKLGQEDETLKEHLKKFDKDYLIQNTNLTWIISKEILEDFEDDNYIKFTQSLEKGFRRNYTYQIADIVTNMFKTGLKRATSEFKNMDQPIINYLMIESSQAEGISAIDMLKRILMINVEKDFEEELADKYKDNLAGKLIEYENLCDNKYENTSEKLFDLRNKEKYSYNINKLHNPIGFGDIFKIWDKNEQKYKKYILLSQPCDIAVRPQGNRKLREGLLFRIHDIDPGHDAVKCLNYLEPGKTHYVDFRDFIALDLGILDLCSLNQDGESKLLIKYLEDIENIDTNKEFYYLNKGLRVRVEELALEIKDKYNQQQKLKDIIKTVTEESHLDETQIELLESNLKSETDIITLDSFKLEDDNIFYNIKRICRLYELVATKLWIDISNYNARVGLPVDFASESRYLKLDLYAKDLRKTIQNKKKVKDNISLKKQIKILKKTDYLDISPDSIKDLKKECCITYEENSQIEIDESNGTVLLKESVIPCFFNDKPYYMDDNHNLSIPMKELLDINEEFKEEVEKQINEGVSNPRFYQLINNDNKELKYYYKFRESQKDLGDYTIITDIKFENEKFILDVDIKKND